MASVTSDSDAPRHDGYTALETLRRGGCATLLRAIRAGDRRAVVLKVLDPRQCREGDLERLRREFELGSSLDLHGVARPIALTTYQGLPALVLQPLAGLIGPPMPIGQFLDLAVRMAGALAELHRGGIVHKDVKPENVLVHPVTRELKLADLGIATRLPREQQPARPPQLIEGSLPYMSPEQTGRTNRAVDSRSDLYSLGVTFFQMLTGRLPFLGGDPLEWVHCHVARAPPPPSALIPEVPVPITRIVLRLLAKMADDRYQTASGLRHDLERCLAQWRAAGRLAPFTLGERDVPDRLQTPQRLYGREAESAALVDAFERVAATGAPELVVVAGYAGIGKSSLVRELQKPIVGRRGLFAEGKFDQFKRDVPYSTIAQALGQLVLDLLAGDAEEVAAWKEQVAIALGVNARLMVDVIPPLQILLGERPPVPELPLGEAKKRFHMVFRQLLGALASAEHPLTLFLDDLQWADSASLELLVEVLTHPGTRHLLAVGAYRDNEVTAAHPLMAALDRLRKGPLALRELTLAPLSRAHLCQLVADALRRPADEVEPLADLVRDKTAGNPFFAIQFLSSLRDDGLLRFDQEALAWRWDIEAARARGYGDNVVDLMLVKLRRLPAEVREAVALAACVGNTADAGALAVLRGRSEEETHRDLWEPVREGLLVRSGGTYGFSHDRVQQAAYALIPEDRRAREHLTIGRMLLAHTPGERLGERVFDIVSQLNRGADLIEAPAERRRLAELDLLAGQTARASAAFGPAARYLAAGMAMLPADAWEAQYDLAYALHMERAQCEYLSGGPAEAERCLASALLHARTLAQKAAVYEARIEVHTIRGEAERAVDSILECAALFGLRLERHPPPESVAQRYAELMRRLGGRSIEQIADLPPMCDPDARALAEVLEAAIPAAYQVDMCLDFAVISEAVRLSIEHGNTPCSVSAYGGLGALIGPLLGRYREGYRFAKVGRDLVERDHLVTYRAQNCFAFGYIAAFFTHHVRGCLPILEDGLRTGAEKGALAVACYCAQAVVTVLLARGDALGEVERRSTRALGFLRAAGYGDMEDAVLAARRLARRLRGRDSPAPRDLPAEDEGLDARIRDRVPLAIYCHLVRELQASFLFGDLQGALSAALRADPLAWTSPCFWERCEHSYFLALTLAALHAQASPREREEHLRTLRAEAERHRVWAENCPDNFANRHALVAAEIARITGDEAEADRLYEEAIRSARAEGFVQNEALAYELASRSYRARGRDLIADSYLREARARYLRWGAEGKVAQLDEEHPSLLEARPSAPTATLMVRSEQLDLLSVVKASQTISGEMEIPRLIGTLLQIALEQGGAHRGCLVLAREGALFVEAEASMEEQGVVTRVMPSLPLESSALLPASVANYARTVRRPLIIEDAAAATSRFSADAYFARHGTRSVLCLPILRQADLVGLLYLENRHVAGAFTPDHLTALSLLASQAAISVQNARLIQEERRERQRSAFLDEAGALLSASLDFEETLARLSRLCVQSLADWCVLDLVEDRELRRVAGACADPAREPLLEELRRRYPARRDSPHPAARGLRAGEPLLVPTFTDELLRSMCVDEEHVDLVRRLGTRSLLLVPLVARGQTLGALTLASASPDRYGRAELDLAQEVARRAASAIDNARLYREIQRADQRKSEFIAVLSHELRNPLASVRAGVQLLRRSPPGGSVAARAQEIVERQAAHLARLVDDLLDITRISRGKIELHRVPIDVGALVRAACDDLRALFERGGVDLRVELPSSPVRVEADAQRLTQAIGNLLQNAVKFTPAGGRVTASVTARGECAQVSVRDTGVGMEPAEVERMFEPFAQAEQGLARTHGGLGLGLALAKGLVELHDGSISAHSEGPGRGSAFVVTLPLAR
jgi:predicted ATPase/signal transduction histidine kinase/tRNA A-37 threonylcarbamoyl transferase component Bud32